MKKAMKRALEIFFSLSGTLLAVYVGGYWLLFRPVRTLYRHLMASTITPHLLFVCILKIFLASTAAGAIWCLFDIIAGKFRD